MNATSASAGVPVESSWEELVSVALLGTERRTPPAWAAGREVPVAVLDAAAVATVRRRAGMRPGGGGGPPPPPAPGPPRPHPPPPP
ncbi:DUF5691 domain-containing protein, partial [Streptomyces fagopyri]